MKKLLLPAAARNLRPQHGKAVRVPEVHVERSHSLLRQQQVVVPAEAVALTEVKSEARLPEMK